MNDRLRYAYQGFLIERSGISSKQIAVWSQDTIVKIHSVRNLAKQHQKQCENDCNGYGFVPRKGFFYNGTIDAYARRTYGPYVKSAYIELCPKCRSNDVYKVPEKDKPSANDDCFVCGKCGVLQENTELLQETVFYQELDRIEAKIKNILASTPLIPRFQHDPRGATVKIKIQPHGIFADERDLTEMLYL